MKQLLLELENQLKKANATVLNSLNSGLDIDKIRNLEKSNNFELIPEIIELYQWKNGSHFTDSGNYFRIKKGTLMPLSKAFAEYNDFIENEFEYFHKFYFPIIESIGGEFLVVECDKKSEMFGMILNYDTKYVFMTNGATPVYDSIPSMIRSIINCFLNKAYFFNEKGKCDIDYDLEKEIIDIHNPNVKKYKSNDSY